MNTVLSFPKSIVPLTVADAVAAVERLAVRLAETAVERDARGGHAAAERQLIRDSGLLSLSVPVEYGGPGISWPVIFRAIRRLAEVDSALAHLLAFHHLQLAGLRLYGTAEQQAEFYGATLREGVFWGNALNPRDKRTTAVEVDGGFLIDGPKSFSSGSVGSDHLTFSAWHEPTRSILIAAIPTDAEGIVVESDWDAFGQRQTDSGTVQFNQVFLPHRAVLQAPGIKPTPQATLRSQVAQLVITNLYVGIGQGALKEARRYLAEEAAPWAASAVARAIDDPFIQRRTAELWLKLKPAALLSDAAAELLQDAWEDGHALTAERRGEVAIAVAEAKVLAHRAGLDTSTEMFDLTGARSTSARYGYDRFWRNVRVHTLHDPIEYKLRDIGRHLLDGQWPEPTSYS
ncbi:acyl-CoA dehydrogenase family protein [soil metagenome]